jgi:hypothetical protein
MIKPGALLMGVVMAVVSAGTYYGLELLPAGLIPAPLGRAVALEPAAAPAQPAPAVVTAAAVAPEPAPAPAEPAPAPAAAAEPFEAPAAEAKAAEAPAAVPAAPMETASTAPASTPAAAADADAIKQWWPEPSTMPANQLKLQYAGQLQGQGAIALLFTSALKLQTLKEFGVIRSASGDIVPGDWTLANNPKMAVFGGLAPGRYTVILQPQVSDQQGFMLGTTLKGPVYIKP